MSYNDDRIISAPVSINDVKEILNESSNDLATLCTNEDINMWSKYKPVNNTLKFVKDTVNSDNNTWKEAVDGKGWWLGEIDRGGRAARAMYFPTITSKSNFKDGSCHPQYVKPSGGELSPYRITDFIGYYDNAVAPMRVLISSQNEIGKEWSCNIQVVDANNYEDFDSSYDPKHCYTWNDILDMLGVENIYPAVLVVNKTKKKQYFYISNQAISSGDNVVKFTLGDGKPFNEGGMGFISEKGDKLEFYVCVTEYNGSDEIYNDFMSAYTPWFDISYASITLTGKTYIYKDFILHGANFSYETYSYIGTRYIRTSDDDILSGSTYLKLNSGGITWKASENDTSGVVITGGYIYVWINIIGSDSDETSSSYASVSYRLPVNPASDKVYPLKDFTSYTYLTQEEAEKGENPVSIEGIIIPDRVVYGSAMFTGKVKKVEVRVAANINYSSDNYRLNQIVKDDIIYTKTF